MLRMHEVVGAKPTTLTVSFPPHLSSPKSQASYLGLRRVTCIKGGSLGAECDACTLVIGTSRLGSIPGAPVLLGRSSAWLERGFWKPEVRGFESRRPDF